MAQFERIRSPHEPAITCSSNAPASCVKNNLSADIRGGMYSVPTQKPLHMYDPHATDRPHAVEAKKQTDSSSDVSRSKHINNNERNDGGDVGSDDSCVTQNRQDGHAPRSAPAMHNPCCCASRCTCANNTTEANSTPFTRHRPCWGVRGTTSGSTFDSNCNPNDNNISNYNYTNSNSNNHDHHESDRDSNRRRCLKNYKDLDETVHDDLGACPSRYCEFCVPERAALAEAELRVRQGRVSAARSCEQRNWPSSSAASAARSEKARGAHRTRESTFLPHGRQGCRSPSSSLHAFPIASCSSAGFAGPNYRHNTSELLRAQQSTRFRRMRNQQYTFRRQKLQEELTARRADLAAMRRCGIETPPLYLASCVDGNEEGGGFVTEASAPAVGGGYGGAGSYGMRRNYGCSPFGRNKTERCLRRGARNTHSSDNHARDDAVSTSSYNNRNVGSCSQVGCNRPGREAGVSLGTPVPCANHMQRRAVRNSARDRRAGQGRHSCPITNRSPMHIGVGASAMQCPVCGGVLRRAHAADVMAMLSSQALHGRVMHCASCGFVGCMGTSPQSSDTQRHTTSLCEKKTSNNNNNGDNNCRSTSTHDHAETMTDAAVGCTDRATQSPVPPSTSQAIHLRAPTCIPSRTPPCRRVGRGVAGAALIGPRFGRKVFITDDDYLERRCRSMAAWEEAGVVRRISPGIHADPCAPLPLKAPRWRTVTTVPC